MFRRSVFRFLTVWCLVPVSVSIPVSAFTQSIYQVGTGQASLEPDGAVFSLSLAGYGAPREGRFSLEWKAAEGILLPESGDIKSALYGSLSGIRQEQAFRVIAVEGKRAFAIGSDQALYQARVSAKPRWKKVMPLQREARSATLKGGVLAILDEHGSVWCTSVGRTASWEKLPEMAGSADVMLHGDQLYLLTSTGEIVRYIRERQEWLRVAIRNGHTYQQEIRRLAAAGDHIYGIGADARVWQAVHRSDGNMAATAMSIRNGKQRVVIAGLDLCGFNAPFIDDIKQEIASRLDIPAEAVLINASHTHFAPVSQNWTTWGPHCQRPDSVYLYGTVRPAVLQAIRQAVGAEREAEIRFGRGKADVGQNRRLSDPAPYDNDVDVIEVSYRKGGDKDLLFLHGCHPVFANAGLEGVTLSANYPAVAREELLRHGEVSRALFVQGCGGDINPADSDHRLSGKKLADAVIQVLDNRRLTPVSGAVNFVMDTIRFPVKPWSVGDLEKFKKQNEGKEGDVSAEKNVRWADLMLDYHRTGTMPTDMPVYIQTLNIGNWKLVGLSREVVTDYSIGIKRLWPDKLVSVAGYCNDVASYLPTRRHIRMGAYEGDESFFWYGQPVIFPDNVYESILSFISSNQR